MNGHARPQHSLPSAAWRKLALLGLAGAGLWCAAAAQAHHSFAAFDTKSTLTLVGDVTQWEWSNPHSWIYIAIKTPTGDSEEWSVEASSPSAFSRRGGSKKMLKVGDRLTITIHPRLDGQHGGSLVSMVLADGRTMGGPGQPSLAAPKE